MNIYLLNQIMDLRTINLAHTMLKMIFIFLFLLILKIIEIFLCNKEYL